MGVSLETYRSRIGAFQSGKAPSASNTKLKTMKCLVANEKALGNIHLESGIFWYEVFSGFPVILLFMTLAEFGLLTSQIASYCPAAPNGELNDWSGVTQPVSASVIKSLLLQSGIESNPGPSADDGASNDDVQHDNQSDESDNSDYLPREDIDYFQPANEIKAGDTFESMRKVRSDVKLYSDRKYFPLIVASSWAGNADKGERGRIRYKCKHGHKRKTVATSVRPWQRLNFTACPCFININENAEGDWVVTKLCLEHSGHVLTKENYYSYPHVRKLSQDDLDFVQVSQNIFLLSQNFSNA